MLDFCRFAAPLPVSNLRYTSRRTEILLDWDFIDLYNEFEISYEPMDGIIPQGSVTRGWPVLIQGLTPGQEYMLTVTTISNDQRSAPATILALTRESAQEEYNY